MATVSIEDIIDAFETQSDESRSYVNRETGEVDVVLLELLSLAEEGGTVDDVLDWQEPEFALALQIIKHRDRFAQLPTRYDLNEWQIMDDFAESVEPEVLSGELQNAIRGPGAFRFFKYIVRQNGIEDDWFAFRDEALREEAIKWCRRNRIEWTTRGPRAEREDELL